MSLFTFSAPLAGALGAVGFVTVSGLLAWLGGSSGPPEDAKDAPSCRVAAASDIEAGKYLVRIGGCNDCHTPGFMQLGMQVPESEWLTGTAVGWRGPWGTTYPSNLRKFVSETPEDVWLTICRERTTRPPMPWDNLHAMSDADLLAIHRYIRHLGPVGERAPEYCDPGVEPATPYFLLDCDELAHLPVYAPAPKAEVCKPEETSAFHVQGIAIRTLIPSCDTRDAYALLEETVPVDARTPLHSLQYQDKVISVLEGELEVQLENELLRVGPGERALVPRTAWHAFRNAGSTPARIHVGVSPGGHDEFLRELARLPEDASPEELAELLASYGVAVAAR